jgi:hypothetical protein
MLILQPYAVAGETMPVLRESEVHNEGYKVDNVKGRIALDVEWNAKDGNLDRDIGAYRALYDAGLMGQFSSPEHKTTSGHSQCALPGRLGCRRTKPASGSRQPRRPIFPSLFLA